MCVCSCLSHPARQSKIVCNLHYTVTCMVCPFLPRFSTLFHKRHDFRETKLIQRKMCILIFSTIFSTIFSLPFVILERMQRDIIINVNRSSHLAPVILVTVTIVTILMKIEHHRQIIQESTNTTFHENPSSGSRGISCEYTKELTDMIKLIVAFRNFAKASLKNMPYDKVNTVILNKHLIYYI